MAQARAGGVPVERSAGGAATANKPPPFGTPRVASEVGTLPRQVDPLDRAPAGTQRFKIRYRHDPHNHESHRPIVYVLAGKGDADGAKKFYLDQQGLSDAGRLVVTPLAD